MKTGITMVLALAVVWGVAGCAGRSQRAVEKQAEQFFTRLSEGKVSEAYGLLAEESRQELDIEEFRAAAEVLKLVGNRGVVWDVPYVDEDYASIEGLVTTSEGIETRQELTFFKKGGVWRLHIVRPAASPIATELNDEARLRKPDANGMEQLAIETVTRLADALLSGDFAEFHDKTAPILREQTTPEVFRDAFAWMASAEMGFDWTAVRNGTPVFDLPPEVGGDGVLSMTGTITTGEKRLGFELKYVYATPTWMLTAINIRPPL